jgi:hypothetical protein
MQQVEAIKFLADGQSYIAELAKMAQADDKLASSGAATGAKLEQVFNRLAQVIGQTYNKNDKAVESFIRSLEKQASAAGKSGIEKLDAQMKHAISTFGTTEERIKRITQAFELQKKALKDTGNQFGNLGSIMQTGFTSPTYAASAAIGGFLRNLGPVGIGIGIVTAGVLTSAAAMFELVKGAGEAQRELSNLAARTGLTVDQAQRLSIAAKLVGVDISALEQSARYVAEALEDSGSKGSKAIRELGISTANFNGTQREEGEVLLDVLNKLSQIPNVAQRVYLSQQLLGRGSKVLQPMIEDLPKLKEAADQLANSLDTGANKELLDADSNIKKMSESWEIFKKNLAAKIAPIVIPIVYYTSQRLTPDASNKAWADQYRIPLGGEIPAKGGYSPGGYQSNPVFGEWFNSYNKSIGGGDALANAAKTRYDRTQQGIEANLAAAKKEEENAFTATQQSGVGKEAEAGLVAKWNKAKNAVKKYEDQLKSLEQSNQAIESLPEKLAHFNETDRGKLYELGTTFNNDLKGLGPADRAKLQQAYQAAYLRELQKHNLSVQNKSTETELSETEMRAKIEQSILESQPGYQKKQPLDVNKFLQERINPNSQNFGFGNVAGPPGPSTAEQLTIAKQAEAFQERVVNLTMKEKDAIGVILQMREDTAKRELEVAQQKASEITNQIDRQKAMYDAQFAYEQQLREVRMQAEEQILQMRKKEHDEIASTATSLYETLFTHPQNFGKALQSTIKKTVIEKSSQSLGKATADLLWPVAPKSSTDPIKQAADYFASRVVGAANAISGGHGGGSPTINVAGGGSTVQQLNRTIDMVSGGGSGSGSISGGPQTPSFVPGVAGSAVSSGSGIAKTSSRFNFGGLFGGGGKSSSGGGFSLGGIAGLFGGGKSSSSGGETIGTLDRNVATNGWPTTGNNAAASGSGIAKTATGMGAGNIGSIFKNGSFNGGNLAQAGASAGTAIGPQLFMHGATGRDEGTAAGVGWDTLGGAATGAGLGFEVGGPIGAAIGAGVGAAAGLFTGLGEMAAGVQSPWAKAKMYCKQDYGITISNTMENQIVQLANSKYGGDINVTCRSPEVRTMLGIYALGTGQSASKLIADTPMGGSLVSSGGRLYQQQEYAYGQGFAYQSALPTLGGNGGVSTIPSSNVSGGTASQPGAMAINIQGADVASFLSGSYVTPSRVSSQFAAAQSQSMGRVANSAIVLDPGLSVS